MVHTLSGEYDFYIITSDRDLGDQVPYPGIPLDQWTTISPHSSVWYAGTGSMSAASLKKLVHEIQPDVVYFNSMFSKAFTLLPLWTLKRMGFKGRRVLAPRGMLQQGAIRRKSFKKNVFLRLFRLSGLADRILFHATDKQEEQDILGFFPGSNTVVAENIPNVAEGAWAPLSKQPGELRCVFISRIHPKKNLLFLLEILGKIPGKIILDIYGEADDQKYTEICKQAASYLPGEINVRFKGPLLHQQVFNTLAQYHIFALPTLGENFGHAVFEALSAGKPVLISDQTPWKELGKIKAGWDLPLDSREGFEKALLQMLQMDQHEYNEWSKNAWGYAHRFMISFDYLTKYAKLFQ